jgi:hypothetical protein
MVEREVVPAFSYLSPCYYTKREREGRDREREDEREKEKGRERVGLTDAAGILTRIYIFFAQQSS